jgi:hypothetical protein
MSVVKSVPKDYKNYDHITKYYERTQVEKEMNKKWKIKYLNPDDENKELDLKTSDDTLIQLKKKVLKIKEKEFDYIRFIFKAPKTEAIYKPNITIINKYTNEIEEILSFEFEVV